MSTLNYHDVARKIYENHDYLRNGWSNDESFLKLDRECCFSNNCVILKKRSIPPKKKKTASTVP